MNISSTIMKASGLSMLLFWTITLSKPTSVDVSLFILLSIIPISICCALTICLTIAPFFWSKKKSTTFKTIYKRYFPFYTIGLFSLCLYGIIESNFNIYALAFFASAFFTSLKSWNWLIKPKTITK
ncbi:hypothetical protein [Thalassobellus sediminis]|uniref:hypothetical protein n=1 Tax=Thalassobellus sediminis TaxID=3367753 RepID=UPI003790481A